MIVMGDWQLHMMRIPFSCRLRDHEKKDPAVLDYLNCENDYAEAAMVDTEKQQDTLYKGIQGRIKEPNQSVPQRYWILLFACFLFAILK